ncbi:hypothetical protein FEM48_Zijuj08G0007100 [Ziziphus jujuba var. spinosa]|uniref:Uncharacterized protein n=1 Tax=Ziziphus jujuba var. spinosa TaxID=714518 RepID=A0A978UW02_ZIZJJ|nr:hypothetical protein FEM48_Zijuj08G0007100 [Ziziphus jujuba var. spinosa]
MLHRNFKPAKCKTALKLAVSRIKLLKNKKEAHVKQLKRELAQLLDSGQVQTARIRVEHVVREEKAITAYDLVETYCELIVARMPIIESQKSCPIDLKEAIASVIFASPRCADIPELMDVRKHFTAKYGKEFASAAVELRPDCGVHRMLVEKLSAKAPDGPTKLKILSAIAAEHNVKWDPDSFSGTDSKASEDLLNGPKTFETASKIQMEPFPDPPLPSSDDKGHSNVQIPNQHDEKRDIFNGDNAGSSSFSQNFASTDVSVNYTTTSGKFHPEVRSSGSRTEQMEFKNSYPGDQNTYSSGRQNWKMQFKDAASAAQAAAESAEQASMAARAAAELSRHSFESQQSSGYVSKDEGREHAVRAPENNAYHGRNSAMHDEHIVDKKQEELSQMSEMFYGDAYKGTDGYSRSASLKSTTASTDDNMLINDLHKIDRYPQKKLFEPKKSDLSGEGSDKNQFSEYLVEPASKLQDGVKSEDITYVGDSRTRKQSSIVSSHSHSSSFSDDQDVLKKNNSYGYLEDMRTEKQSSRISSRSHSNTSNDIHEDDLKKNYLGEDLFVNEGSIYTNTEEMNHNEKSTAVFDDSGSDDDNYKFDMEDYKEQESSSYFSPPSRKLPIELLANSTVWGPKQNLDKEQGKSISKLHSPLEQSSSVFSEGMTGSTIPSNADSLLPVAFDDSDGPSSDSEDLCKSKHVESTTFDKFPHRENVHSVSSEKVQSPSDSSRGSSSDDNENVGSRKMPLLPPSSVDLYLKEESPDRSQGSKFNSVFEQKFDVVELATGPPPTGFMKYGLDSNFRDNFQSPDLPDTMKDTEFSEGSSLQSGKELSFGTLTGGLRNKGNRHPLYARKSLGNSLSSKEETADTFSKIAQSSSSPTVRMSISSVADIQKPYNQQGNSSIDKKTGMRNVDSDDHYLEEKLPEPTFRSQEPYNRKSGVELNKKASSRASVTYFDSDNSDTEENLPKMTSTSNARLASGYSRRTKISSSKSGKTSCSKATVLSEESLAPRAESRSSLSSSYATEIQPNSLSETSSSDHLRGQEQHKSVAPTAESRLSSRSSYAPEIRPYHLSETTSSDRLRGQEQHKSVAPRAESRSSSRSSYAPEIRPYHLSETNSSDCLRGQEQHKSVAPRAESRSSSRSSYAPEIRPYHLSETNSSDCLRGQEQHKSVAPRAESRSSSRSSYATEIRPNRLSETNSSDRLRGQEQHKSAEQDTSKAVPESKRSTRLSSRKQTSNSPSPLKTEASGEASSSKEKASHVHPKLPDYDALTAHFRSLRQGD